MSIHTIRIPLEEFAADVPGFVNRVAESGDRLEVVCRDGTVALPHQDHRPITADYF